MSTPDRLNRRRPAYRVLAVIATMIISMTAVAAGTPAHADAAGVGGDFVPLAAGSRLLDTRDGTGGVTGAVGTQGSVSFPVLGRGGVPSSGVSAVLVDLTAMSPSVRTWLMLWPDGTTRGTYPMVHGPAGVAVSNTAVVEVGTNGRVAAYNRHGTSHIVVDVHGYFTSAAGGAGGGFVPVPQTRLVDTRSTLGGPVGKIPAGGTATFTIGNDAPIPSGAAAAFLNLIVVGATQRGAITAYPAGGASGNNTLNYLEDHTASGAAVQLGTAGRIVVRNNGSAPIDLIIEAQGYFSGSTAEGAGFRPLLARLHDTRVTGVRLAANTDIEVQVAGTNGLPTRGIAGVVLGFEVINPGQRGNLVAWPKGEARPSVSVANFRANEHRGGMTVVQPGVDGYVVIRNNSGAAIDLWVGLQGWFADPLPAVPVARSSRTSVLQADPIGSAQHGMIYYSYVNNIGQSFVGRQVDPDSASSVQWTAVSGNEAYTGAPGLAQQPDGRIQVALQAVDSNVRTVRQVDPGGPALTAPTQIGGSPATPPVAGQLPGGTVVLFAVDLDGRLWAYHQSGAAAWRSLGLAELSGTPATSATADGVRVTGTTAAGAVVTAVYRPDGTLTGWTDLGAADFAGQPATVVYPGFRTMVIARTAAGSLLVKQQEFDGSWPSAWQPVGPAFAAAGAPAAILDPAVGRTAVVARGTDNEVYVSWETAQGSGDFGAWNQVAVGSDPAATDPAVALVSNSTGQSWSIVFRTASDAHRVYWRDAGSIPLPITTRSATAHSGSSNPSFTGHTLTVPPDSR